MPNLFDIDVTGVSLVKRASVRNPSNPTEPQEFLLYKAESGASTTPEGGDPTMADPTIEEVRAALAKAEQEREAALARIAELEKAAKPAEPKVDPLNKAELPEPVRVALEKAEDDRKEALAKAEEATKIAKAERDARIEAEFIKKAESDYPYVGGDASEFGRLLKTASETLSKEDYAALETRFKAANEQMRVSKLLKDVGRGGEPEVSGDESDALLAKAAELRKSDTSLSQYDALVLAGKDPQVAAQYAVGR